MQENRSTCGVLYEVVTGIPKSEGMDPPPKIPANPSFVELDEDENAVEKFKRAMTSVSSILHLDKLKQVSICHVITLTTPILSLPTLGHTLGHSPVYHSLSYTTCMRMHVGRAVCDYRDTTLRSSCPVCRYDGLLRRGNRSGKDSLTHSLIKIYPLSCPLIGS